METVTVLISVVLSAAVRRTICEDRAVRAPLSSGDRVKDAN